MASPQYQLIPNVPYTTSDLDAHRLNVYVPSHPIAPCCPVVVHVHGGGWKRGGRDAMFYGAPFMAQGYAEKGFVSVAVSYRLKVQHPTHITDVATALAWVYNHIAEYGGDPECIFLSGHSAGGHLVSLITLDPQYIKAVGLPDNVIKAVVTLSGVYWLFNPISKVDCFISAVYRKIYITPTFGSDADALATASPLHHVRSLPQFQQALCKPQPELVTDTASVSGSTTDVSSEHTASDESASHHDPDDEEFQRALTESERAELLATGESAAYGTTTTTTATTTATTAAAVAVAEPLMVAAAQEAAQHRPPPPPFLIVNAASDLGLDMDGERFFAEMESRGCDVQRVVVAKTNHGTVTRSPVTLDMAARFLLHQWRHAAEQQFGSLPLSPSRAAAAAAVAAATGTVAGAAV